MPNRPSSLVRFCTLLGSAFGLAVALGCMSISIGKFATAITDDTGALCQSDEVTMPPGTEREIYYPIPYAQPPHLEVGNTPFNDIVLMEQKETHFRVRNGSAFAKGVAWKARGVRAGSLTPPPLPAPPPVGDPLPKSE